MKKRMKKKKMSNRAREPAILRSQSATKAKTKKRAMTSKILTTKATLKAAIWRDVWMNLRTRMRSPRRSKSPRARINMQLRSTILRAIEYTNLCIFCA